MTPHQEALRRIADAKAANADLLDLGNLPLDELPEELSRLSQLRILVLGATEVADIGPLAGLTALQSLDLSYCDLVTNLSPLAGLTALQSLDLSYCDLVTDLSPLAGLTALQSLHFMSTISRPNGVTDLSPLAGLTALQSLHISFCVRVTDIGPLAGLTALRLLVLSECSGVTDIRPLARLTALQSLLIDTGGIDIGPLAGLTTLQSLDLGWCTRLTDIGPLAGLTALQSLDLRLCNRVTDIGPLAGLTALQSLELKWCDGVTDIGPLAGLTALRRLGLAKCRAIRRFSKLDNLLPTLERLNLHGCHFDDLPEEVCGIEDDDNVIDRVRAHYADLKRGAQDDTELKVFVLGNGGVGKSHLCNRIKGGKYPANPVSIASTHGVQVEEFPLEIAGSEQPARVNLWDFGGQDIYHGSHALFLQQRAVFLLLWHPDMERGEFHQDGITMRHRPLAYWLDYVRNVAGTDASVLIVQSQCDSRTQKRPLPVPLPDDFAFVRALEVSAKTGIGLTELKGALAGAIEELFGKRPPPKIGIGRVEMRRQVREKAPTSRTISVAEFHDLCIANGKIADPDALLDFFHECGVVFYRPGMFDDRIILDQNWALAAIYTLLDRGKTLPALNHSGRFTRTDLQHLVWHGKSDADCDTLLGMMRSCGICFKARELRLDNDKKLTQYIAPELLPRWSESLVPMFRLLLRDPNHLGFEIRYPFLHDGILRGFLSRLGDIAGDHAVYWKYGCWFHEQRSDCDVFIESRWDEADPDHSRGSITVRAWGRNPEEVLRSISKLLQDHRMAQKPEMHYLNFAGFGQRGEMLPEADVPLIVSAPGTRAVLPDNLGKQVYLSYAWGEDETEIGRQREAAARRTRERLTEAGYEVTYDKKDMKLGDLISKFILRIGTAENVVAIISKKYLESPYCVKELYSIFRDSWHDKTLFLERIHPIILQDARLSDILTLEQYRAFWEGKKEETKRRFPHGSEGGVLSVVDIDHWLLDMTTVLSLLNDKLSPPIADGDLDRMIDAVLQMLDRIGRE